MGGRSQGMKGLGAFEVNPSLESHEGSLNKITLFFLNYFLIRKCLCIYELIIKKRKRKKNKIAAIANLQRRRESRSVVSDSL